MDLLAGRRFSVASYGIAAAYAGWLLRQFGAEVDHRTALDPEALGAFLGEGAAFQAAPGLSTPAGVPLLTDAPLSEANREQIERLSRHSEVLWITPWGLANGWSERPWSDLTLHAAGGWMASVGEPDREPLGPPGAQGQFVAGLFATIAALRGCTSPVPGAEAGGLVDVSIIESITATMIYDAVAFQYYGTIRGRVGNRFARTQPTIVTLPCKDGYIGLHAALHGQWLALCRLVGHPELAKDPRFASLPARAANIAALDEYLLPWLAQRTRFEAYHELQQARIPSAALPDVAEVLASPQLEARGSLRSVPTPRGPSLRVPGPPARIVAESERGEPPRAAKASPWRDGCLRVVDLSMGWAGPMVSLILAAFGADVIKVESHTHFDWWRGSRPPGDDPSLALHEHSHVFNTANRGKRGITLNLATPRGIELAKDLIAGADLVVENFGAGVIEKMGLTYGVLSAGNPALIMLRQPGFGSSGPETHYLTFGNTIEGMSGLTSLMGYEGGPPTMMSNAFGDPVSGLTGTVAVLAALAARERDGRGRLLECAQLEGFLPLVSEALIAYQRTGEVPRRHGNERTGHLPSGLFPCAGEDMWVALDVATDAEWAALAAVIGEPWAQAETLSTLAGRTADRPSLLDGLSRWTSTRERDWVAETCATAGIAAAPMLNESEVLFAEPLTTGFWEGQERAHAGFHHYPSLPFAVAGARHLSPGPAPTLGEHNAEVFAGMGLSRDDVATLHETGVAGDVPAG